MPIADNKRRVGILLDVEVLNAIDEYASKNGISRGSAISILCVEALEQKMFMKTFPSLLKITENEK